MISDEGDGIEPVAAFQAMKDGVAGEEETTQDTTEAEGAEEPSGGEQAESEEGVAAAGVDGEDDAGDEDGASDQDVAADAEPDAEPAAEAEAVEPAPEPEPVVSEEELTYKERYRHLQSQKDKEVAEANAKLEAYQELLGSMNDAVGEEDERPEMPSEEEVDAYIQSAPGDAFRYMMHNHPEAMPAVIAKIEEAHGREAGLQAQESWQNAREMAFAQQQAEKERVAAEAAEASTKASEATTAATAYMRETYKDDFTSLEGEVVAEVQRVVADEALHAQAKELYGDNATAFLEATFNKVWRQKASASIAERAHDEPIPQPSFAETGGAKHEEPEVSYQDQKMDRFKRLIGDDN